MSVYQPKVFYLINSIIGLHYFLRLGGLLQNAQISPETSIVTYLPQQLQ